MTLIIILIALGLDYFLGGLEPYRKFNWFISLHYSLEKRLAHYKYWDSTLSLLGLLSIAILGLLVVMFLLDYWSWIAETVFTLLVLIYCLAPENLDNQLDQYITAVEKEDASVAASLTEKLINETVINDEDSNEATIIKSAFIDAHKRTFAVIFWFLILGVVGALLYRLVNELNDELHEIRSGFSDSTNILLNILEWPSSRLMLIGLALGGSLVDALPDWGKSEHLSFEVNNQVLTEAGMGALQYLPEVEVPGREKSYWISELKSLLNRTLIIWLAILGIMTLSGTLG